MQPFRYQTTKRLLIIILSGLWSINAFANDVTIKIIHNITIGELILKSTGRCEIDREGNLSGFSCDKFLSNTIDTGRIVIEGDLNRDLFITAEPYTTADVTFTPVLYNRLTSEIVTNFATLSTPAIKKGKASTTVGQLILDIGLLIDINNKNASGKALDIPITITADYQD